MKASKSLTYDAASRELTVTRRFRLDRRQLGILRKMSRNKGWIEFRGHDEPSDADETAIEGLRKAGLIQWIQEAWHSTYKLTKSGTEVARAIAGQGGADARTR